MNENDLMEPSKNAGGGAVARMVPVQGVVINNMDDLARFSNMIIQSRLAPKGIDTPQKAAVVIQMGLELGLKPITALQNISVINGSPALFGDIAKALVESSRLLADYEEYTGMWCDDCLAEAAAGGKCPRCGASLTKEHVGFIVRSLRKGRKQPIVSGFNIRQAKRAGLWNKEGPWRQYPQRMLMFRARAFNLRDNFSDVLKGLPTVEELRDIPPHEQEQEQEQEQAEHVNPEPPQLAHAGKDYGRLPPEKITALQTLMNEKGFVWGEKNQNNRGSVCKLRGWPFSKKIEDLSTIECEVLCRDLLQEPDAF